MKKIVLLFVLGLLLTFSNIQAQDTCSGAVSVTTGVTTVGTIDGSEVPQPLCSSANGPVPPGDNPAGEWYSFTPSQDGVYILTTDLPQNSGGDTRVHIYEGSCNNLSCVAGNDDVDVGNANFLSETAFEGESGTTYYIAFDNRWDDAGFDFELTLDPNLNCNDNDSYPYNQEWTNTSDPSGGSVFKFNTCWTKENNTSMAGWTINSANDFDGDGNNDPIVNVFPQNTPVPAKDHWLISTGFVMDINFQYNITIEYNGVDVNGTANESFDLVVLDQPTQSASNQTVLNSYTNITQQGEFSPGPTGQNLFEAAYSNTETFVPNSNGTFYFAVHLNSPADGDIFFIKSITVEEENLSTDEFSQVNFEFFVNNNQLNLSASQSFEKINIFDLSGKQVMSNQLSSNDEVIDVQNLANGLYFGKVQIGEQTKTFKFVK